MSGYSFLNAHLRFFKLINDNLKQCVWLSLISALTFRNMLKLRNMVKYYIRHKIETLFAGATCEKF